MEAKNQIQLRTDSSDVCISTVSELVAVRLDESRFPRYRNIPQGARLEWMSLQIKYLAAITRLRDFGKNETILIASALNGMIAEDAALADLTLPEIADAFKNGVFGKYGEFYGLSAPNLLNFLYSFLESEKKINAAAVVRKSKEAILAERRKAEREAEQRKIQAEIAEAKRNGSFVPTWRVKYCPAKVEDTIGRQDAEHRERVRLQAEAVMKQAKAEGRA